MIYWDSILSAQTIERRKWITVTLFIFILRLEINVYASFSRDIFATVDVFEYHLVMLAVNLNITCR